MAGGEEMGNINFGKCLICVQYVNFITKSLNYVFN